MIVPTYVVEEHNEAYFIWKYAIRNNFLLESNNTLLHIDEHSDMSTPNLNISLHHLNGNLSDIKSFTENELHIASFIAPAIYNRIFNKVIWVRYRHVGKINIENKMYCRSYNGEGEKLIISELSRLKDVEGTDDEFKSEIRKFSYFKNHISDISNLKNVALDIDLDYFSCIQNPLEEELKIEISKQEYLKFKNNKYHRIRYFDFGKVSAESVGDKYYYCLNNFKNRYLSPLLVDEDQILSRIRAVIDVLRTQEIKPQIITICRSRYSGYTSRDQWSFIEEKLIENLNECFDLSIHPISSL